MAKVPVGVTFVSTSDNLAQSDQIKKNVDDSTSPSVAQEILDLQTENPDTHLNQIESILFNGASATIDHSADRVDIANGFSYGADYRDNAQGEVQDSTHYFSNDVSIVGNLAANDFIFTGRTEHKLLFAINLDIDSVGRTGVGAMVVLRDSVGTEYDFIHIDSDRKIQVRTTPQTANTDVAVSDELGDIVLENDSSYWLLCEIFPELTRWELLVAVLRIPDSGDVSVKSANNIDLDLSSMSTERLGLSRSSNQIARMDQFRVTSIPNYITHSTLANLVTNHISDKWCLGYHRLLSGSDNNKIDFATELGLPDGSTLNGSPINKSELVVYQSTGKGTAVGELVATVNLPANYGDYNYIHITEYDVNSLQFRHAEIPTEPFTSGNVGSNDNVRLQGNTVMSWTAGTRTLAMNPSAQEIYRVSLKD